MTPIVRQNRSILSGVGAITLAVIVTVIALATVITLFLYQPCVAAFQSTQKLYPGAALVASESNFLSYQRVVYHSADTPEAVSDWYSQQRAVQMRVSVLSGDFSAVPKPNWLVEADVERGGSAITFAGYCP